ARGDRDHGDLRRQHPRGGDDRPRPGAVVERELGVGGRAPRRAGARARRHRRRRPLRARDVQRAAPRLVAPPRRARRGRLAPPRTRAPVWAVLLGGVLSALCVGLGLRRLVELDVLLYGAALLLEFAALVALRIREPGLRRPFKVPGGTAGAAALCLPPTALILVAAWKGRGEPAALGMTALELSGAIAGV